VLRKLETKKVNSKHLIMQQNYSDPCSELLYPINSEVLHHGATHKTLLLISSEAGRCTQPVGGRVERKKRKGGGNGDRKMKVIYKLERNRNEIVPKIG
jgi:hypothetical protein